MDTALIIFGVVVFIVIGYFLVADKMPVPYRFRNCQGKGWKKSFPAASKQEIRDFLTDFFCAFALPERDLLKLHPTDRVYDIYKALNPCEWAGDALELETLADTLKDKYGLQFSEVWHDDLSLGDLFRVTRKAT